MAREIDLNFLEEINKFTKRRIVIMKDNDKICGYFIGLLKDEMKNISHCAN